MIKFANPIISKVPPVGRSEIELAMKTLDCRFPQEVIDFYLQYNGGVPTRKKLPKPFQQYQVHGIDSFNKQGEDMGFVYSNTVIVDYLPEKVYVFGNDPFSNLFCFSCRENDFGEIFLFDTHQVEQDNLDWLAKDLKTFIDSLE